MDKNVKKNKLAKAKAEEEALNNILTWVAGGAVLEFLLLLLNRYWSHYRIGTELNFRLNILEPGVKIVAFLALAAALFLGYRWNQKDRKGRLTVASALVCLGLSAGCFAAWLLGSSGLTVVYTAVPVILLLAVIYYLYQREFFLIATFSALSIGGVWLCSHGMSGRTAVICWLYTLCALVLCGGAAWICSKCQKDNGSFLWKETKLRLFDKKANYLLLYISAGVTALVLLCAAVSLPVMALYAVAVAWLLVMAVYYTVKLM